MVLTVGETYVEPGFVATENEVDITDKVVVSGDVDVSTAGYYEINYSVENVDGFESVLTRLVLVVPDGLSDVDLSGSYSGTADLGTFSEVCMISKLANGVFKGTDFFGGRYAFGREYGSRYSLKSYFILKSDNTYQALKTDSPWGPWDIIGGVYDPTTNTLSHRVDQDGFGFDVALTKE